MHRRGADDFYRAGEILGHLVDRHPRSAAPHTWTALWHVLSINKGLTPGSHDTERALDHVHRALDINPDSAMSMAMEAFVHCHLKRDLPAARKRLTDSLAVNSSDPWTWLVLSVVVSFLGYGEQAWEAALRARALSPMDPLKHYFDGLTASAAVCAGRYAEALQFARLSLSKDARHLPTLRALAIAQVRLGQGDAARDTMTKVMQLQPTFNLRDYVAMAPAGGEAMRMQWAEALRDAGAPHG
jgi:tetratricopeptide (TPR) repeat protein